MSKVIGDCIGFALLRSVIGLKNSRHPLNQSDAKVKPIATWLLTFSRASGRLHVLTVSSHWLLVMLTVVLIGCCDYFGFGFKTLNRKALYLKLTASKLKWHKSQKLCNSKLKTNYVIVRKNIVC